MGEEGHVMLLLAGDLGCDLRVGRTFRTPQRGFWRQGLAHRQQNPFKKIPSAGIRATDLHFRDYMLDGSCGGAEVLKGSFPLARPAE